MSMKDRFDREFKNIIISYENKIFEATVFYCSRFLEGYLRRIIEENTKKSHKNFYSLALKIEFYNIVSSSLINLIHLIRRLGNDIRHDFNKTISEVEVRFCLYSFVLVLGGLKEYDREHHFNVISNDSFRKLHNILKYKTYFKLLADLSSYDTKSTELYKEKHPNLFTHALNFPVVKSLYIEALINNANDFNKNMEYVIDLLEKGQDENIRLQQLLSLALKKTGQNKSALKLLRKVKLKYPNDDETISLLASAYREEYRINSNIHDLTKSNNLFKEVFDSTSNLYSGINASSTALYLKEFKESREIASRIIEIINEKMEVTKKELEELSLWDVATMAEAYFITGELSKSRKTYRLFFDVISDKNSWMCKSAINQLKINLLNLFGKSDEELFFSNQEELNQPLKIGITGHRQFDFNKRVKQEITQKLYQLIDNGTEVSFYTSYADGADRWVIELFKKEFFNKYSTTIVLPFETHEYSKDFSGKSLSDFQQALICSDKVIFPVRNFKDKDDGYLQAGKIVASKCDILLAIWDGEKSAGKGGTGDIVEYAQEKEVKTIIIKVAR